MSNFTTWIKHPQTGESVQANFIDNYFENREYGVVILGSKDTDPVYRGDEVKIDEEAIEKEEEELFKLLNKTK